jgi:hypothetical protein
MTCSRSPISPRWMRNKPCSSTMNIEGIEIVAPVGADPASALTAWAWYNASVTYRADDPDSGSDSPCSSIPPPISSIHSLRSACLYHSCSLIRSFGFHMFLTSFPFHSKTVRLYIPPVFVLLVSSLGIDLISGSLSPLALVRARRRLRCSSSLLFLLQRRVDRCRASTLPHSPSSSRTPLPIPHPPTGMLSNSVPLHHLFSNHHNGRAPFSWKFQTMDNAPPKGLGEPRGRGHLERLR